MCHSLSYLREGLSMALTLCPPPQLLTLIDNSHLSLSVSCLCLNVSTTPLILDNNQECCFQQIRNTKCVEYLINALWYMQRW